MSALARRPHSGETRIRPLTTSRLDEVLAIEQVSFSDPWSREMFRSELEIGGGTYARIAEQDGALVGYLCAVLVEDEAHVGNLAVHPAERRQGVAQALIDDLVLAARKRGIIRVTLEVRASNESARKFYYKNDFIDVAIRKNYYRKPVEDAIVMMRIVREGPTA
jgi:[ribosomal protein S18]-alanine N-acetyltransferase